MATAFEEMTLGTAKQQAELVFPDQPSERDSLAQRLAILMVQARAAECRHLAGEMLLNLGTTTAQLMSRDLTERSHRLEAKAMEWAKQSPFAPKPEDVVQ